MNILTKRQITLAMLLLYSLIPITVFAHGDTPPTPDNIVPPEPIELPEPSDQQTLFYIDPTQLEAQYSVQEIYVGGLDGALVVGSTSEMTGDILIDLEDPARSLLGMVTVNVEKLTSDSKQRDRQIRKSYLESTLYPEAVFIPEPDQIFADAITIGEPLSFILHGYLTVHDVTVLVDWDVDLVVEQDRIEGKATTDILMSDFGVGPISIVGLLSTEDKMQLTLDFVALADGVVAPIASEQVVITETILSNDTIFSEQIQPILETKCVGCHVEGEIGYSVYPMETVADVVEYADDLALVVKTDFMPPWPPGHLSPAFKNDRSLSDSNRAALLAWIDVGAPTDRPFDTYLENKAPVGQAIREDIILTMPESYVPVGDVIDDYRCFLLDPQLPNGGFVTGSNVIPGDRRVVHHVLIFQSSPNSRQEAEARAAEDNRPGWECFGGPGLSSAELGSVGDSLGVWVPGSQPWIAENGVGVYVPPNGLIVLQVHYNYTAEFLPDQTGIILQVESVESGIIPLRGLPLTAPVEIPCPVDSDNAACDRELAIVEHSDFDQELSGLLLEVCHKDKADYASQTAENATSYCDWRVPIDGEVIQVNGHMHTLGKSLHLTLNPDGESPIILLDLPAWDFDWQGSYQLVNPVAVKEGDMLRLTCTWDNSRLADPEDARYITWGEGTADEMCLNLVKIKPASGFEDVEGTALRRGMLNLSRSQKMLFVVKQSPALFVAFLVATLLVAGIIIYGVRLRLRRE